MSFWMIKIKLINQNGSLNKYSYNIQDLTSKGIFTIPNKQELSLFKK
jgi:hypothetical protein